MPSPLNGPSSLVPLKGPWKRHVDLTEPGSVFKGEAPPKPVPVRGPVMYAFVEPSDAEPVANTVRAPHEESTQLDMKPMPTPAGPGTHSRVFSALRRLAIQSPMTSADSAPTPPGQLGPETIRELQHSARQPGPVFAGIEPKPEVVILPKGNVVGGPRRKSLADALRTVGERVRPPGEFDTSDPRQPRLHEWHGLPIHERLNLRAISDWAHQLATAVTTQTEHRNDAQRTREFPRLALPERAIYAGHTVRTFEDVRRMIESKTPNSELVIALGDYLELIISGAYADRNQLDEIAPKIAVQHSRSGIRSSQQQSILDIDLSILRIDDSGDYSVFPLKAYCTGVLDLVRHAKQTFAEAQMADGQRQAMASKDRFFQGLLKGAYRGEHQLPGLEDIIQQTIDRLLPPEIPETHAVRQAIKANATNGLYERLAESALAPDNPAAIQASLFGIFHSTIASVFQDTSSAQTVRNTENHDLIRRWVPQAVTDDGRPALETTALKAAMRQNGRLMVTTREDRLDPISTSLETHVGILGTMLFVVSPAPEKPSGNLTTVDESLLPESTEPIDARDWTFGVMDAITLTPDAAGVVASCLDDLTKRPSHHGR